MTPRTTYQTSLIDYCASRASSIKTTLPGTRQLLGLDPEAVTRRITLRGGSKKMAFLAHQKDETGKDGELCGVPFSSQGLVAVG